MKKKSFKKMRDKYYRTLKRAIKAEGKVRGAEAERDSAVETAEYYKERFRNFGNNVKTIGEGKGYSLVQEEWTLEPEPYGTYAQYVDIIDGGGEFREFVVRNLTEKIAKGLIENNLVQIIEKSGGVFGTPTLAVKLFVVPWEQIPHKKTIALRRYVEDTLQEGM